MTHTLHRRSDRGACSVRSSRGLALVAYSKIALKWSRRNLIAKLTGTCSRSERSGVSGDSAWEVAFPLTDSPFGLDSGVDGRLSFLIHRSRFQGVEAFTHSSNAGGLVPRLPRTPIEALRTTESLLSECDDQGVEGLQSTIQQFSESTRHRQHEPDCRGSIAYFKEYLAK